MVMANRKPRKIYVQPHTRINSDTGEVSRLLLLLCGGFLLFHFFLTGFCDFYVHWTGGVGGVPCLHCRSGGVHAYTLP